MQLEVLVGQVCEDGDVVRDATDPVQGQAMGGGLDNCRPVAGIDHRSQGSLQLRRLRCRDVLGVGAPKLADFELGRGQKAGRDPRCLQHRGGQERRGCLAVRAGDADDAQLATRVAVPPGGGDGQRRLRAIDHDLRNGHSCERTLHDYGRGAEGHGRRQVVVAVDMLARNRHEDRTGLHTPGVESQAADRCRSCRDLPGRGRARRHLRHPDGPQPALGFEAFDQIAQPARGLLLGRRDQLRQSALAART